MPGADASNLPKVLSVLEQLTEEELVELNRVIIARLRLMQQIRDHGHMVGLRLGQSVEFTDSAGRVVRGVVARHNRKSVTVVTDNGMQWRVAPSLLRAAR
jgi:acetylornithine/succinyldiaminopimelate/putrescine aminotransferase